MISKHFLPCGVTCRTFAKPVIEVLFIEVAFRADWILRWVETVEILIGRSMVAGS